MDAVPLIEVDGLTFSYRTATIPALTDVSLVVRPGEVVLVAGPSGCGKSTLVRAMNGLIPHTYHGALSGGVRLDGLSVAELPLRSVGQRVGTVLQDPARQLVASTVLGELAFGPENLGIDRTEIRGRLNRVVSQVQIGHLLERQTDELSGGERQLVAVAAVLMMEPAIILVDEPLANLDPATAQRLVGLLGDLATAGTAVVMVEHRIEDVLELRPGTVLYLDRGRTRYLGDLDGFLEAADPSAVKLPYPIVEARVLRARGALPERSEPPVGSHGRTGEPRLAYRVVSAGYDGRRVFRDLDATLERRHRVAILGPNGSGKSTMLKLAMALLRPWTGDVLVDGTSTAARSVADLAAIFGYVFQNPGQMLFAPTVDDELWFGPHNLGRGEDERAAIVTDALRRVALDEVEGIAGRPPLSLSFGQQKRLAIAVALAIQPRTLLLDEPSSGQDHLNAGRFMHEVRSIEGLESIYFVTHDVDLALTHADDVILLADGRVAAQGTPAVVAADEQLWRACHLRVTSLMRANARWRAHTGRFMGPEALAGWVAMHDGGRMPSGGHAGEHTEDARDSRA
ncbi:MAG: ABC transporter ATP-binding protein [Candidatus Limnocylindria bacterium]